jgi:molybdate transport system substrate-binding protein
VVTLISEILPEPGVELAGPLPADFQSYLVFAAATGTKSGKTQSSKALISFLAAPSAGPIYQAKGMQR